MNYQNPKHYGFSPDGEDVSFGELKDGEYVTRDDYEALLFNRNYYARQFILNSISDVEDMYFVCKRCGGAGTERNTVIHTDSCSVGQLIEEMKKIK